MTQAANNARYEARQKEKGYVRGPRIRGEAAERLRDLAYLHNLTPCEVVSRLLLDEPLPIPGNPFGLSPDELRHARLQGYAA